MRIGDGSSDVSSSDLQFFSFPFHPAQRVAVDELSKPESQAIDDHAAPLARPARESRRKLGPALHGAPVRRPPRPVPRDADRSNVGSGKSVTVREDLGGRSTIKKKQTKNKKEDQ